MDTVPARAVLVVAGLLLVASCAAAALLRRGWSAPRPAWTLVWVGLSTAAFQAPSHLLISGGAVGRPFLVLAVAAALAGLALGVASLRGASQASASQSSAVTRISTDSSGRRMGA